MFPSSTRAWYIFLKAKPDPRGIRNQVCRIRAYLNNPTPALRAGSRRAGIAFRPRLRRVNGISSNRNQGAEYGENTQSTRNCRQVPAYRGSERHVQSPSRPSARFRDTMSEYLA